MCNIVEHKRRLVHHVFGQVTFRLLKVLSECRARKTKKRMKIFWLRAITTKWDSNFGLWTIGPCIYYLLRTTLIPWYTASYGKLIVAHLVKKLPAFTKPEDSSTFQLLTLSGANSIQFTFSHLIFLRTTSVTGALSNLRLVLQAFPLSEVAQPKLNIQLSPASCMLRVLRIHSSFT